MSYSVPGFSPWRKRASSLLSQQSQFPQDGQDATSSQSINDIPDDTSSQVASARLLSSSIIGTPPRGHREPIRSFIHGSERGQLAPIDSEQNARTVREDTAELASYLLSDGKANRNASFLKRSRSSVQGLFDPDHPEDSESINNTVGSSQSTAGVSDAPDLPPSDERLSSGGQDDSDGPSVLSNLLRRSPPQSITQDIPAEYAFNRKESRVIPDESSGDESQDTQFNAEDNAATTENTPLLGATASVRVRRNSTDLEEQGLHRRKRWFSGLVEGGHKFEQHLVHVVGVAANPRRWDGRAIWDTTIVGPVSCLPAVAVGLLLNILDALSYGMILFPLGKPIFSHLGSAGISIYYVSTIVSQIVFSTGSIFRGAVGSELIEVVPFFHNMAQKITDIVGEENPDAVIATTIVAYSLSSMMTGLVFYLMGKFKFGFMVGFIPRHILIGCIGGVGWFLIATGFEVSARLDGSLQYDLDTIEKLIQPGTWQLWLLPFVLSVILFWGQSKVANKYFLPLYILAIPAVFYILVTSLDALDVDDLRDHGWIFQGPPPGEPWWYFYTLYQFNLVRWDAIIDVVPAMMALTFFGVLHVPINVPALALNTGEDNADLDKELKLHGYSNIISGCLGSIQNYLVYANTVFFIRSGGNRRLAGYILALFTFGVMLIGPTLIGFIPVMMVGTLIFDLGFELLLEAIWLPRKKLKIAEYLTVIVIVLVMGIHDFVVGIGVGILLAFVSLIVQTSRVSAIRGAYDGDIVTSTVRRNPSQHHYLHQVGKQIYIVKLTGYLFFGTIVSVEEKIRALLDDNAFTKKPIKFLILDMWHVTGLDYSAGEAFNTVSRLLDNKGVLLVLSGVDAESQLGRNLRAVGLGNGAIQVMMLPNLNSALESCENELLKTLYARQEELNATKRLATANLDVPGGTSSGLSSFDPPFNSPRQSHLVEAAREVLPNVEVQRPLKWQSFKEPLRIMLQIFQGLSD